MVFLSQTPVALLRKLNYVAVSTEVGYTYGSQEGQVKKQPFSRSFRRICDCQWRTCDNCKYLYIFFFFFRKSELSSGKHSCINKKDGFLQWLL